jgi:fructose-bisphosphate aldolase class I
MLGESNGVIAPFSRAAAEGLNAQKSDTDFDAMLNATIWSIYEASIK